MSHDPPSSTALPYSVLTLTALMLSGAAGLVYEVVWTRAIATLFGSAIAATGLILALFMICLGIGAELGGRWVRRTDRPLRFFAAVEIALGALATATPCLLTSIAEITHMTEEALGSSFSVLTPVILCSLALGPIIVLMGTTFPLFLAHRARDRAELARDTGWVYGINTLGAVCGTLAGSFILLPQLGIRASLFVAAGTDIAVGLVCLLASRDSSSVVPTARHPSQTRPLPWSDSGLRLALALALLAGGASLILEVAWFRLLMLIIGSSTYAMGIMLSAFLAGIATGACVVAPHCANRYETRTCLAGLHVFIALSSTLVTLFIQVFPLLYISLIEATHGAYGGIALGSFILLFCLLFVPTTLMGAALPMTIRLGCSGSSEGISDASGRVYGAASLGSGIGALVAGFLLLTLCGIRGTVGVAVTLSLVCCVLILFVSARLINRRLLLQAGAVTLGIWCIWMAGWLPWNWRILTAGYYAYAHLYAGETATTMQPTRRESVFLREVAFPQARVSSPAVKHPTATKPQSEAEELLFLEEGRYAQVAVVSDNGVRSLLLNGKADASNGDLDMRTQLLLGLLPALLSPVTPASSDTAMVIGFGSGVTAYAVACWPFQRIVAAEIEPAVIRASQFFSAENHEVFNDPRLDLRLGDARRTLRRLDGGLRLLTSEPSNLWMAGVSHLFTEEFFALAAAKLDDAGVLCQWIHLYQVGADDVKTLVQTMGRSFPYMVAFADGSDLLLVASRSPLNLDPESWQARLEAMPRAADAMARTGIGSAAQLVSGLVADQRGLDLWSHLAPLHTDDLPLLEFSAARCMGVDDSALIMAAIVQEAAKLGPIKLGDVAYVTTPVKSALRFTKTPP